MEKTEKRNPSKEITEKIIRQLENGTIPWKKPWFGVRSGAKSYSTGKPYSLLNQFILMKPGYYLTFNQAQKLGGHVKKGAKADFIYFWNMIHKTEENKSGEKVQVTIPYLKAYAVFHEDDCEDIPKKSESEKLLLPEFSPIDSAENVFAAYIKREHIGFSNVKGDRAFYSPLSDSITLPLKEQFAKPAAYYSTLYHEAAHSTGAKNRLNRFEENSYFGSEPYSKEELVAEISAAVSLNELGIDTPDTEQNTIAYCQSWLKVLKNDPKFIISAASKADKAVKLIWGDIEEEKGAEANE